MSPGVDIIGANGLDPFPGEGLPLSAAERAAAVAPTSLVVAARAVIDRLRRLHRDVEAASPLPPARLAAAVALHTDLVEAALQLAAVIEVDGRAPTTELHAAIDRALESAKTLGFDRVLENRQGVDFFFLRCAMLGARLCLPGNEPGNERGTP